MNKIQKQLLTAGLLIAAVLLTGAFSVAEEVPQWVDLFNGKDLTGWVNVNTDEDTWYVEDGLLKCKGMPIGVMRTDRQYENFLLHIEWRHMEAGGNSGVFAWSRRAMHSLPWRMRLSLLNS